MLILRTPDARFAGLPDFDYEPHYAEVAAGEQVERLVEGDGSGGGGSGGDGSGGDRLRMAWVEAGPVDGDVVLCLHGEPSWSFLYRRMMPVLADAGLRVLCPDLIGFGRSDKPARRADHSYARQVEWVRELAFDVLDLRSITVVGQDWGGLIGLRLAAEHPERFSRIVAANTGLPTGDHPMPEIWHQFRVAMQDAPSIDIGRFVQSGCLTPLPPAVRAGYDAPFPDESYCAGPRAMPGLVPITPDDPASAANRAAWQVLSSSSTPFLVAFSDGDPITGSLAPILKRQLAGAQGIEHPVIAGAGHFLQEDAGPRLAAAIVGFIAEHPAH